MTHRLMLLQMRGRGIPMDSQTIAESCNVGNYGTIPGNTVLDRAKHEKEEELLFGLRLKKIAESEGLDPALLGGGKKGEKQGGRPPSGNAPPELKSKDGGRPTVTESN